MPTLLVPTRHSRHSIPLRRPHFGELAQQVAGVRTRDLQVVLDEQQRDGGRLGDLLITHGLLNYDQVREVLRLQAQWLAATHRADVAPYGLPDPRSLSLCMPAYNEAENIESCIDAAVTVLPEFFRDFEVVVVNDGSRDNTAQIVQDYHQRDNRVRLVNHSVNRGYGAAVTSGLRGATGDLICFTDGDGQFSPLDVLQLLIALDDADVAIGYRYQRADVGARKLNAWAWNRLIRLILGVRVRDLDCAFKLFTRAVIDRLELTAQGACINAEILVQCVRLGCQIREVPVMHYPRYRGAPTGANLKVIAKAFRELPQLWKYRSIQSSPLGQPTPAGEHSAA
jgi:hypothetical protein